MSIVEHTPFGPTRPPRDRHLRRRLRDWAARHPVTAFLVLTFSGAYPLVGVWGLAYHGMLPGGSAREWLHIDPGEVAGLALTPPLFLAALYVTWAADGRAGVTVCCGG